MPAPTSTRVPPRRSWWNPASMAAFLPEHSSTTWTARARSARAPTPGRSRGRPGRAPRRRRGRGPAAGAARPARPRHRADAPGHQGGDGQCADGARADDHDRVAGDDPRPGDAVQRHGQRLGQRRLAGGQSGGQAQQGGGPYQHVAGEGAVRGVDDRALGSRTARACPPGTAGSCRTGGTGPRRPRRRPPIRRRPRPQRRWSRCTRGRRPDPACPTPRAAGGCPTRRCRSGRPRPGPRPGRDGAPAGPRPPPPRAVGRPRRASPRAVRSGRHLFPLGPGPGTPSVRALQPASL